MPEIRLSRRAAADLADIAAFTIRQFGIEQARRYREAFERTFALIAERPQRGRSAAALAVGLRRITCQAHVVFYRADETGVLVVRVLHQRMDFERHPMRDG